MNEFCVALLQLLPEETQEGNLQKGLEACRRAKAMGADLALFPEVWNIGYRLEQPPEALAEAAIGLEGPFLQAFRRRWTWPSPLPTWSGLPPCPGTP